MFCLFGLEGRVGGGVFIFIPVSFSKFGGGGIFNKTIIPLAMFGYVSHSLHLARKYSRIFIRGHY